VEDTLLWKMMSMIVVAGLKNNLLARWIATPLSAARNDGGCGMVLCGTFDVCAGL
jgi:hypothetical protein